MTTLLIKAFCVCGKPATLEHMLTHTTAYSFNLVALHEALNKPIKSAHIRIEDWKEYGRT